MYSWKDRLIDWVNQRGGWTHILVAVAITVLITTIILGLAMPKKGVVNTNAADIGVLQGNFVTIANGLATKVSQAELDDFAGNVTDAFNGQAGDINKLRTRVKTAEDNLTDTKTYLDSVGNQTTIHGTNITALQAWAGNVSTNITTILAQIEAATNQTVINEHDIIVLGELADAIAGNMTTTLTTLAGLDVRMDDAEVCITDIEDDLEDALNSPPEAYLTGTFGDYAVHAKSSEAGNFTANVHLVYSRAFGFNGTYEEAQQHFYSDINWTVATPAYTTVVTFNGTAWSLSELWWNIGIFQLKANDDKEVAITCVGLNSTWEPSFAYVEIYPALK